jgi:hypothetical protein
MTIDKDENIIVQFGGIIYTAIFATKTFVEIPATNSFILSNRAMPNGDLYIAPSNGGV